MTMYIFGLIVLKLLSTAVFFLGLYKIVTLVHGKVVKRAAEGESRGEIILKERFAAGEIEEEKFRTMMSVLKS